MSKWDMNNWDTKIRIGVSIGVGVGAGIGDAVYGVVEGDTGVDLAIGAAVTGAGTFGVFLVVLYGIALWSKRRDKS